MRKVACWAETKGSSAKRMAPRVRPTVQPVTGSLKRWPRVVPATTASPKREAAGAGRAPEAGAAAGLGAPAAGAPAAGAEGRVTGAAGKRGAATPGAARVARGMPPAEATGAGVREEAGRRPGGRPVSGGVRETPELGLPAEEAGGVLEGGGFAVAGASLSEVPQLAQASARGGL